MVYRRALTVSDGERPQGVDRPSVNLMTVSAVLSVALPVSDGERSEAGADLRVAGSTDAVQPHGAD